MPNYCYIDKILKNSFKELQYQEVIDNCDEILEQINKEPMEDILPKHKVIELKLQAMKALNDLYL